MSRTNLIFADLLFTVASLMIYSTDGLKKYPVILAPLLVLAFVTCVIRHITYFNMTRKIY